MEASSEDIPLWRGTKGEDKSRKYSPLSIPQRRDSAPLQTVSKIEPNDFFH